MKRILLLFFLFFNAGLILAAQTDFLDPQAAPKATSREEEIYSSANDALTNGRYDEAVKGFDQVAGMHGRRADAALYWKAYALNKGGQKPEALTTLAELLKQYPQSKYVRDAKALQVEIGGGQVDPNEESDDELKIMAVNSLMTTDPQRAFPILEKILQGNGSERLKDRALFVLSQNKSQKAQQLLVAVAKGANQPKLQKHAIRYLGISGKENVPLLQEVYTSSSDPEVKSAVLNAFLTSGAKENVLAVVRQEKSPELRRKAIHTLGALGARQEIRQFYKEATDTETKRDLLQAMMMNGDSEAIFEAAKNERDPEVRRKAIETLGTVGGQESLTELTSIYNSQADVETKKYVIRGLFIHGDAKDMVALARKETNPELRKELVRYLSLMRSPEATEYMLEILNK